MSSTKEVPLFRRYANRKLYHVQSHHYVTLSDIAQIIKKTNGEFEVDKLFGMTKQQFMLAILESKQKEAKIDPALAKRAILAGGLVEYIKKLEKKAGVQ